MGLRKEDIELADYALQKMRDIELGYASIDDLLRRAKSEDQVERISQSFCDMGIATRTLVSLSGNFKLKAIIAEGGARYIYDQEQFAAKKRKLEMADLTLSIFEKKRNKYLSISSIIISITAIMITLFK